MGQLIGSIRECMHQEHRGIGGLYFITTMVICAFILFSTVRLSWDSQAVAMSDNLAYITSINVAVNGYIDNVYIPAGNYPGPLPFTNHPYNALADFNSMLRNAGIISGADSCSIAQISWNGRNAVVQYGEFRTSLGSMIMPHQQESIIEND
jgi:hypothetical protein